MGAVAFDTYEAMHDLQQAGLSEPAAKAIVTTMQSSLHDQLATKTDLLALKTDLFALKTDISEIRTELKGDISSLRTELKGDISSLRTELKIDMKNMQIYLMVWITVVVGVGFASLAWLR